MTTSVGDTTGYTSLKDVRVVDDLPKTRLAAAVDRAMGALGLDPSQKELDEIKNKMANDVDGKAFRELRLRQIRKGCGITFSGALTVTAIIKLWGTAWFLIPLIPCGGLGYWFWYERKVNQISQEAVNDPIEEAVPGKNILLAPEIAAYLDRVASVTQDAQARLVLSHLRKHFRLHPAQAAKITNDISRAMLFDKALQSNLNDREALQKSKAALSRRQASESTWFDANSTLTDRSIPLDDPYSEEACLQAFTDVTSQLDARLSQVS